MNLPHRKATQANNLQPATLVFLLRGDNEILLAMKKRGFGQGLWNATGGKVKPGEKSDEAAIREAFEELGVVVKNLKHVATIEFYFDGVPNFAGQRVVGYTTREWEGEPKETEEMAPKWFKYDQIPYDQMWKDDIIWLPLVLAGKNVEGEFLFGEDNSILEHGVRIAN